MVLRVEDDRRRRAPDRAGTQLPLERDLRSHLRGRARRSPAPRARAHAVGANARRHPQRRLLQYRPRAESVRDGLRPSAGREAHTRAFRGAARSGNHGHRARHERVGPAHLGTAGRGRTGGRRAHGPGSQLASRGQSQRRPAGAHPRPRHCRASVERAMAVYSQRLGVSTLADPGLQGQPGHPRRRRRPRNQRRCRSAAYNAQGQWGVGTRLSAGHRVPPSQASAGGVFELSLAHEAFHCIQFAIEPNWAGNAESGSRRARPTGR